MPYRYHFPWLLDLYIYHTFPLKLGKKEKEAALFTKQLNFNQAG